MTPPSNAGGEGREVLALLPCPFCGGEAYHPVIQGTRRSEVWCRGCEVEMHSGEDGIPEAREMWNTRLARENADDRAPALVEAAVAEMREKAAKVGDAVADAILDLLAETGTVTDARAAAHMAAEAIADRIRALPTSSQEASNVG